MANEVAVSVKIYLEDQSKLEETIKEINKVVKVNNYKIEDVAFGIKALKIIFLMNDEGGIDEIEEKLNSLPNVSNAQIEEVSRI